MCEREGVFGCKSERKRERGGENRELTSESSKDFTGGEKVSQETEPDKWVLNQSKINERREIKCGNRWK